MAPRRRIRSPESGKTVAAAVLGSGPSVVTAAGQLDGAPLTLGTRHITLNSCIRLKAPSAELAVCSEYGHGTAEATIFDVRPWQTLLRIQEEKVRAHTQGVPGYKLKGDMSSTKMKKGILRPFRYISNMMDGKETQELQIGFPTDVKHVAHIGWDGPSVTNNNAAAPTWMKDYHSAPLDSASFRSERGPSPSSNQWASQEIVLDGGGLGDTSFRETRSEAGSIDITAGDSPPSPNTRRSRRHRSRGSGATSSMDCTGTEASEKKEKTKKSSRGKNRKKDKADKPAGDEAAAAAAPAANTCQDLPAVPKKSNRRKNKGSSEASGDAAAAAAKDAGAAPEEAPPPLPPVTEEAKDHE
ncbi:hypothetical protein GUJ93_ZPchr0013g34809 [Zizania palustris]|uniref:CRIB domain-containing protein n=1 Tax=Zizania palustris TaxID=103762 RepID=A0A8J5WY02_ZIZPA|nr:hypothetical protein GUJ93_ZPchr0013g34809 [Zizania palustris]